MSVVGQARSTQRLPAPVPPDEELALRAFLRDFSRRRPRWGWRRAARAARDAGWRVNDKRIHRLWRAEGLRVPYRKRKKPLRGIGAAVGAFCPIRPNVVWALDFQFDQTRRRQDAQALNVIDEYSRECLAIDVERSIDADGVVACLERLAAQRGARPTCASTTGPSSSPTRCQTGAASAAPTPSSSIPAARGRTPGSNRSTAACATST